MKKRVKQLVAIILSSAMVMSLAACGTSETETESSDATSAEATETVSTDADEGTPVLGGSVTLRYTEFYGEYDPGACNNRACNTFMYDMLWNLDWETDPDEFTFAGTYLSSDYLTGQVAESWEVADDYTSIMVHLRDDVYFQDKVAAGFDEEYDIYKGRQLVADDVKFSYARLIGIDGYEQVELDQTNWSNDLAMLESIEVVDDQTLIFYLNTNTQVGVNSFMCARVQLAGPEWDELTSEQKVDWQYASGTGPFILQNYVTDNTMTFVKNPNYWQTDSDGVQLPYLDEVNLVYFADAETTMASFISG
ncbi:MAG: hypothetical protein K6G40_02255, partial [Eubacterium sp.]|nr:hypothetical protein [Eubacterium sp.]